MSYLFECHVRPPNDKKMAQVSLHAIFFMGLMTPILSCGHFFNATDVFQVTSHATSDFHLFQDGDFICPGVQTLLRLSVLVVRMEHDPFLHLAHPLHKAGIRQL